MKQIHKEYLKPFLLEPTKLTRIVDTIHEKLQDHPNTTIHDRFEVFLTENRSEELQNLEDVLALDNSHKQKIQRLLIVSSATVQNALRPEHEIQVDFAGTTINPTNSNKNIKLVAIDIRSDQTSWANRALSEVEEQIERTWQRYLQPVLVLVVLVACVFMVLISQFVSFSIGDLAYRQWLRGTDLDRLEMILKQNRTITDEEMREITTMQLRNILAQQRPKQSSYKGQTRHLVTIGIPFLIVLVCGVTLLTTCYPRTVFLWGDENDRYTHVLQKRKNLWAVIIAVVITGMGSKFLFEGIDSWLPK